MRKGELIKRITSVALALLLATTSVPATTASAYAAEYNGMDNAITDIEVNERSADSEMISAEAEADEAAVESETDENGLESEADGPETESDEITVESDENDEIGPESDENGLEADENVSESDENGLKPEEVNESETSAEEIEYLQEVDDDPEKAKGERQRNFDMSQAIPFSSAESLDVAYLYGDVSKYRHGQYATNYYIRKGIDVSTHQGTIDWKTVAANGVEFAFIRVAFRGWGAAGNMKSDDRYVTNIKNAQAAGIPVGVYIFSQATTVEEARAEADLALNNIKGYKIQLPVIMDFEYADTGAGVGGRLYNANLTKEQATNICNAFCKRVADAGYEPMVYANKDMLTNHLNASQISNKYKIWIARWNIETGYSGEYSYWQFSDKGAVNGITGAVDLDFGYELIEDEPDTDRYVSDVKAAAYDEITQSVTNVDKDVRLSVNPGTEISLASDTQNTAIFYTTGATKAATPVPALDSGIRYTEPIKITKPTVIKAIAMKTQFKDSAVVTFSFDVNDLSNEQGDVAAEDMPEGDSQAEKVAKISDNVWISVIPDQIYSGKAIRPAFRVYSGKKLLAEKKDYTVSYKNNVNAGTATVIIKGAGSYAGTYQTTFDIERKDISEAVNEIAPISAAFNRKNQAQAIVLTVDGRKLTLNRDYTLSIVKKAENDAEADVAVTMCKDPGTYICSVSAKENGNYQGSGTVTLVIRDNVTSLSNAKIIVAGQNYADWYDFGADENDDSDDRLTDPHDSSRSFALTGVDGGIRPVIKVTDRSGNEIPDSEYDVSFSRNCEVGNATVTISAKSDSPEYVGSKSQTFRINGYAISKANIFYSNEETGVTTDITRGLTAGYSGKAIEPLGNAESLTNDVPDNIVVSMALKRGEEPLILKKGRDFKVSYINNIKAGNATVVLTGIGRFTGSLKKTFKIQNFVAENDGLNKYIFVKFVNADRSVSKEDTLNGGSRNVAEYDYVKGGVVPQIKVYYEPEGVVTPLTTEPSSDAIELVAGADYTVRHINNKAANSFDVINARKVCVAPQVVITGKKSFKGSLNVTYTILQKNIENMLMTAPDRVCNGQPGQYTVTPELTDPKGGKKLVAGVDYERKLVYSLAEATYVLKYNSIWDKSYKRWIAAGTVLNPSTDIITDNTAIRVTATGKGNYTGTISAVYRMNNLSIAAATVKVADQNYLGKAVRPGKGDITSITIRVNGKTQKLNPEDYEITGYQKNTGRGTGIMTIHGLGNFCGYKNVRFKINARSFFYIIEFDANSQTATGTMSRQNVFFKGTKLSASRYKNTGYVFAGWNTKPDGSGESFADLQTLDTIYPGAVLKLYAQWKKADI